MKTKNAESRPVSDKFGYILFKNGQIGPEPVYFENLPDKLNMTSQKVILTELGLYLSLVISQGKGMDKEGLFGPLPWYQLPENELFLFSFLLKDPKIEDERKKENLLCFLAIFFPRKEEAIINSRIEIETSLEELLIKEKTDRLIFNNETIEFIISNSKKIFLEALNSGEKISQEKALDEIIQLESMELFAVYSSKNKLLKSCLIGKEKDLPPVSFLNELTTDNYQLTARDHSDGTSSLLLEFTEVDMSIFIRLVHHLESHELIQLLTKIDSSLEILSTYIS